MFTVKSIKVGTPRIFTVIVLKIALLPGMDFASSTRTAENRTGWKGIVGNPSVVPRQPSKVMG